MKNLILTCLACLFVFASIQAQEEGQEEATSGGASISDIMNVAPVAAESANEAEIEAEYQEAFDKAKSKLDESIAKANESYRKNVQGVMEKFTKLLSKGIKKDVDVAKPRTAGEVNSLTIAFRAAKKQEVVNFKTELDRTINALPAHMIRAKQKELNKVVDEYYVTFDQEYEGNQQAIETFRNTEHVLDEAPAAEASEESDQ